MSAFNEQLAQLNALVLRGFAHLKQQCTRDGRLQAAALDAAQVPSYDLAFCAAELAAAGAALDYAQRVVSVDALGVELARAFAAEVYASVIARLAARPADFGLPLADILAAHPGHRPQLLAYTQGATLSALGAQLLARDGRLPPTLLEAEHEMMRDSFAQFAQQVVAPLAQSIHRDDLDVPAQIIDGAAALGLFGVSVPQRFGGLQPDDAPDTLAMLVVTEALSAVSLGAAGSLITRPEILVRALLAGGTDAQRAHWLPRIASGEKLVAISITEPDFGSDVASLKMRATRCEGGWRLQGAKTWCTWAGRADVIMMVVRTHPDASLGHRGLSLFLIEKPQFAGHEFEWREPRGGVMTARAIRTLGYRGMHSFDLHLENFFVPEDALIGGTEGEGRGFYLTMSGLAGGRVQTSARANGTMQGALSAASAYAQSRRVFGQAIASYPLMQARVARIAAWLTASRQLSYAVARQLDAGDGDMEASLVKLFACRASEWVTRDAMQMHGGLGYAEECVASRFFVDARVLSIFEGAEETLALKVVARELISRA